MIRNRQRTWAACVAAITLLAFSAGSGATDRPAAGHQEPFGQFDHDGDGFISYSEAKADPALSEDFNRLDDDKNGELDRGEFAQFEAQGLTKTPDILPPEPPADTQKAPPLPLRGRDLNPPPPQPPPLGPPTTDHLPRP